MFPKKTRRASAAGPQGPIGGAPGAAGAGHAPDFPSGGESGHDIATGVLTGVRQDLTPELQIPGASQSPFGVGAIPV